MKKATFGLLAAVLFLSAALPTAARADQLAPQPKAIESFDSGMLHVDRYGNGASSVVFIPGLASGPWTWYEQIARFSPKYSVYAITLPGFDGRAASSAPDLFSTFSNDFFAMLASRHIVKPVVVGHSLGGTLAIQLAEDRPEALAGIVAVDGLPIFPTLAQSTAEQRQAIAKSSAMQYASLSRDQALAYENNYMSSVGTTDKAFAPTLAALAAKSDPKAVAAWLEADLAHDLRPQLSRIAIPFVEIQPYASPSPYSASDTTAFYKMLLAGAPTAEVVSIAPSRHYAMFDQPAQFDATLEAFLRKAQ